MSSLQRDKALTAVELIERDVQNLANIRLVEVLLAAIEAYDRPGKCKKHGTCLIRYSMVKASIHKFKKDAWEGRRGANAALQAFESVKDQFRAMYYSATCTCSPTEKQELNKKGNKNVIYNGFTGSGDYQRLRNELGYRERPTRSTDFYRTR